MKGRHKSLNGVLRAGWLGVALCFGMVLFGYGWAGDSRAPATPVENPKALRQTLLSIHDTAGLQRFLIERKLAVQEENTPLGLEDHDGQLVALTAADLAVDLFFSNLFGDPRPEAIFQIRFRHSLYFLTFYYQENDHWYRVPGIITANRETLSNTPCNLVAPANGAYFVFSLEQARAAGEYVVVGKTYGGWCPPGGGDRGSQITLYIWQITKTGMHRLFADVLQSLWIRSPLPVPIKEPKNQHCQWLPASPVTVFPKRLACEVAVYEQAEETLPDDSQALTWKRTGARSEIHELDYAR